MLLRQKDISEITEGKKVTLSPGYELLAVNHERQSFMLPFSLKVECGQYAAIRWPVNIQQAVLIRDNYFYSGLVITDYKAERLCGLYRDEDGKKQQDIA
jgi:hypothetical protein